MSRLGSSKGFGVKKTAMDDYSLDAKTNNKSNQLQRCKRISYCNPGQLYTDTLPSNNTE